MSELTNLREALSKISDIASAAAGNGHAAGSDSSESEVTGFCTSKYLPEELQVTAAKTATDINPANAPVFGFMPTDESLASLVSSPQAIVVLTSKYWGSARRRLTVSFMETTPADLRNRILSHMNAWACGVQFVYTAGTGQVRISRGAGGFWSYLGTDILHIAAGRQTMNLQGFTMSTRDSEFYRVVRHETGHTLGFPHEHMRREIVARIDPQKAYPWFLQTYGWNKATVDAQVLTPLDNSSIFGTPADQTSIMCYQLPAAITRDGRPIIGGTDINPTDRAFGKRIYPPASAAPGDVQEESYWKKTYQDDSEFVSEPALVE